MRCKICGASLKKEGDICKNCYQKYKDKEDLKNINEEKLFEIKRKYSPKFNLLKNGEMILILVLVSLTGFATYGNWFGILITLMCIVAFGAWMFYNKKRAAGTKTTFYETRFKYRAKYPLVDKEEIILYKDIKDMAYFQSRSQKMNKIGDIRFYTKGFLNGITIHDIPDIEESFVKMRDIINASKEKTN